MEIKKARRSFEEKLALNIKSDKKSFFAYARGSGRAKITQGPLVGSDGMVMEEMTDMVEEYNRYFSTVFTLENIQNLPRAEMMYTGEERDKCKDVGFTEDDIMQILKRIRPDKAAGADDMAPRLLAQVR